MVQPTTYTQYHQALVEIALERLGSGLDSTMDDVFAALLTRYPGINRSLLCSWRFVTPENEAAWTAAEAL
jgi:hypothetical protein